MMFINIGNDRIINLDNVVLIQKTRTDPAIWRFDFNFASTVADAPFFITIQEKSMSAEILAFIEKLES